MSASFRLGAVLLALALPGMLVASRLLPSEQTTFSLDGVPSEVPGYSGIAEQDRKSVV